MATGTATLNFGAAPGTDYTSVDVTGLSGLTTASHLEPWIQADTTTDHSPDEHRAESMDIYAEYLTATSFRIHGQIRFGQAMGSFTVHYATL